MFKQFIKDSIVYTIANTLIRGVSYLLLPLYTKQLTPVDFGLTDLLLVFTHFICLTVALEITQGVAIYYAINKTEQEKKSYASTSLWFALAAYSIFVIISLIFAQPLSELLFHAKSKSLIFSLSVISTWGYGLSYLAMTQLRMDFKPQKYALTGLIISIFSITSSIILVLFLKLGAIGVVAGQMVGNLAGTVAGVAFCKNIYARIFDFNKLKQMLAFSIPLVPSSISSFVIGNINRLLINSILTIADVGIFGIAYRITSIIEIIMVGFRTALTPLIYSNYQKDETPGEIARIFKYFIAFALLFILFLSFFSKEIIQLLTQPLYYKAASIIPILTPAFILGQMNIFTPGWAIKKKTKGFAAINIFGAVLTTALCLSLIPQFGIDGAAWANLVANTLIFSAFMIQSQKNYYVPHNWKKIGNALLIGIFLLVAGIYVRDMNYQILSIIIRGLFIFFAFIGFLLLELIDIKDIRNLYKKVIEVL